MIVRGSNRISFKSVIPVTAGSFFFDDNIIAHKSHDQLFGNKHIIPCIHGCDKIEVTGSEFFPGEKVLQSGVFMIFCVPVIDKMEIQHTMLGNKAETRETRTFTIVEPIFVGISSVKFIAY